MNRYPTCFAVSLTILILVQVSSGQSKTDQTRVRETTFASNPNSSRSVPVERRQISSHSLALALQSYQMGVKYSRAGLFRQAAESFEKAVEFDPTFADAHLGLGNAYLNLKEWSKAVRSFEQAVRFNAKSEEAQTKLAEARLKWHIASNPPPQTGNTSNNTKASLSAAGKPSTDATASLSDVNSSSDNLTKSPKDAKDESNSSSDASNSVAANSAPPKPEDDPTRVYRIGVGDILDVRLADTSETNSFTVTPTGLLEHPNLVEPLPVSGLTVEEIKIRLEEDLRRRAITDAPKVAVSIREYVSHAILVSGLVKEPGTKLLRREAIPLYVVVADAQPLTEAGRLTLIQNESRKVLNIDLSEPAQMNILVRSGDVITVQRNPTLFFYLGGDVKSPGEKPFRPGITLTQAILIAGGLINKGKEAQLAREKADGFLQVMRYKLKDINSGKREDPLIQPGDRITIVN